MDEGDGDVKIDIVSDLNEDLRFQDPNLIPLPLLIGQREIGHRFYHSTSQHLERWGEESLVQRQHSQLSCKLPGTPKSTFLMVFSPDGTKVASTHGDHNIYVTDVKTGKCICTLQGHPRTPWCVAFHPSSNEIIASGCLGGEVRVWDLKGGSEMWTPEKKNVIASLAFHPTDKVLVIATDNELYFWDWFRPEPFAKICTGSEREKVKYVKFDPLGYKLITGIANTRFDRHRLESNHGGYNANTNNTNNTGASSFRSSVPTTSETCARTSQSITGGPCRISRFIDRCRNRFGINNQISVTPNESSQTNNSAGLTLSQRIALGQARNFARFATDGSERSSTQETGAVHGPASLSEPQSLENASSRRRYHPRSTSSRDGSLRDAPPTPLDEEIRLGEMRHPLRPVSDDSASSSSLDSSSSVTSGISGTSHERNTRLSLLWASRLNRTGNESDNSAGGGYDLEERRGEGSVMRGGAGGTSELRIGNSVRSDVSFHTEGNDGRADSDRDALRDRERNLITRSLHPVPNQRAGIEVSTNSAQALNEGGDMGNEDNEDENNADYIQQRASCARTSAPRNCGQGGRWMYYRGKISGVPSSRNRSLRGSSRGAENNDNSSTTPNNRNLRSSSSNSMINRIRSMTANSQSTLSTEDQDSLAIPGPSGLSQNGASPAVDLPSSESFTQTSSSRSRSQGHSILDPQFGVQLLSRHIENMQRICRSLSIPRAHLELTRHRHEISRLQQIRSMLYDIQHQIRSLRASVDQTISEEFSGVANDESLNSTSINPESLGSELLNNETQNLTDEIELEVNIGEDLEQYSYSTLAEEDPDQLAAGLVPTSSEIHSATSMTDENATENSALPVSRNRGGNLSHSRSNAATSRHNARSRNVIRLQRLQSNSRIRNRHIRNRLVWPGLIRRLPSQRRSTRSRLNLSAPINVNPNDVVVTRTSVGANASANSLRTGTRRRTSGDLRESRSVREMRLNARDKRYNIRRSELNGGLGRRADPNGPSSSASATNQQPESELQVRSRHSSDWQRRLRSILASDQEWHTPPLNSEIGSDSAPLASQSRNSPANPSSMIYSSSPNRNVNYFSNNLLLGDTQSNNSLSHASSASTNILSSNPPSTTSTNSFSVACNRQSSSNMPSTNSCNRQTPSNTTSLLYSSDAIPATSDTSNLNRNSNLVSCSPDADQEEMDAMPERLPRAGPPTTSLSSRIAMMLTQQEEARNRNAEVSSSRPPLDSAGARARVRLRALGISQLRYDLQRRLGRSGSQNLPFPPLYGANLSPYYLSLPIFDDDMLQLNEQDIGDVSNRPVLQSLRSLRREIISHRNRMLRRSCNSLVSGGDLAGATLAAINTGIPSERDRQRETFRQERRENYRHILQLMADRLNHMMNQSHITNPGRGNPIPFDPDDEEGEIMELPSLQPSQPSVRRRTGFTNGLPRSGGATNRVLNDSTPASANNSASSTSALDSHMYRSLFDACSPSFCGASIATHRIQAWDFRHFEIPDISDSFSNMVVSKCKIHFDASVSISVDGNLFAALIPDTQPLTRVGVYSLETKTLGQLLYNGTIDSNTICVSLSPTMRHLVVGIASYNTRPSVHPNEKQVVARIYKLCDNPMFHNRGQTGDLQFIRGIELQTDHRQISLNCIRWMPYPGQGLIYGTNRGQLTILR